ncbi:hypothetical protein VNI00_004096 [Paramarasmius palmivorus]|uniref:Uncharacterized protein n=1 Tax=Paramarasmius palmivorus TaxID=297713 RepID=A0AAW0DQM9_9AGAR
MNKVYVEQAVQTEPPRHLSRPDKSLQKQQETDPGAYSHPSRSLKPSQLPYAKPSQLNGPTQRVVSLPESSPPYRLKPTGDRYRVASMSETVKVSVPADLDDSLSSECLESSLSLESSQSSLDKLISRPRTSLHSVTFPRTPSPPSSPESSIMIIGNNVEVSHSFLRHQPHRYEEKCDWSTWANSPPRPIPALHGPLSLPYARCPSGAEGTLVEGEDLSRMIWGLREDEVTPPAPRNEFLVDNDAQANVFSDQQIQSNYQSNQPPTAVLSSSSDASKIPSHEKDHALHGLPTPPDLPAPRYLLEKRRDDSPIIIPPTPQQLEHLMEIRRILEPIGSRHPMPNPGLGFIWQRPDTRDESRSSLAGDTARLQPSAPVFIPTRFQNDSQLRGPRHVNTMRDIPDIQRSQPVSAGELATEYVLRQQARHTLLTPPSSSPMAWSPHLSDVAHPEIPFEPGGSFGCLDKGVPSCGFGPGAYLDESHHSLFQPTTASSNHRHLSTRSVSVDPTPLTQVPPSPESPVVMDTTHRFTQHPRSVPFARLLQRRLSVVPEEDTGSARIHPAKPTTQNRRTGFHNGAQAPNKPYFAQAIHSLPDISNKPAINSTPSGIRRHSSTSASPDPRIAQTNTNVTVSHKSNGSLSKTLEPDSDNILDDSSQRKLKVAEEMSTVEGGSKENTKAGNSASKKRGRNRAKRVAPKNVSTVTM